MSDIVSKMTGNLILFEPFHPSVTAYARQFAYASIQTGNDAALLKAYLSDVLAKRHRKMWLMRNHVPVPLEKTSSMFLETLWTECHVTGFKEIRANFLIEWLHENFDAKIVFIVRHPCAVIASIKNRANFWEFGWPHTYELFLEKTLYHASYTTHPITRYKTLVTEAKTAIAQYAVMWAITHAIALPQLEKLGLPLFYYEDFYAAPFQAVKRLAKYLGSSVASIHPSYIFTPSMTTLKTFHGLHGMEETIAQQGARLFWEEQLSDDEVEEIFTVLDRFDIRLYDRNGLHANDVSPTHRLDKQPYVRKNYAYHVD